MAILKASVVWPPPGRYRDQIDDPDSEAPGFDVTRSLC
jgi:hypothetical protein